MTMTTTASEMDRLAQLTAEQLASPYGRPSASVAMDLRRMVDVFVGQVKTWRGGSTSGDFYFDFARMSGGEVLDRVLRRLGTLADAQARGGMSFVEPMRDLGIRIGIDVPEFSSAWMQRDPRLARGARAPRFTVWFDGFQIRIRDVMLVGTANSSRTPERAVDMPDLLESAASLRAFLSVVAEAITAVTEEGLR